MSDMSEPLLSGAPTDVALAPAAPAVSGQQAFAWPTPRDTGYPLPSLMNRPEPAELEGPNGKVTLCQLLGMNVEAGTVKVMTATSRQPLRLKLTQLRRLSLLKPLKPQARQGATAQGRPARGNLKQLHITFKDGQATELKSLVPVELPIGFFTFTPLGTGGDLLRSFYPGPMVARLRVGEAQPPGGPRNPPPVLTEALPTPSTVAAAAIQNARQTVSGPGSSPGRAPTTASAAPATTSAPANAVGPTSPAPAPAPAPAPGPARRAPASRPAQIPPRSDAPAPSAAADQWQLELAPEVSLPTLAPPTPRSAPSPAPQPEAKATADDLGLPELELDLDLAFAPVAKPGPTAQPPSAPAARLTPATSGAPPADGDALPTLSLAPFGEPPAAAPAARASATDTGKPIAAAQAPAAQPALAAKAQPLSLSPANPAAELPLPPRSEILAMARAKVKADHRAKASASGETDGKPGHKSDAASSAAPAPAPGRDLGNLLQTDQINTPEALLEAIAQQARMPMVRIGEALMALGFLTEQKLGDALQAQSRDRNLPLGELLVRRGDVSRADLQTALARKMGYPIVDVATFPVAHDAALKLPLTTARRLPALPLMFSGGKVVVALEDPSARNVLDEIEFSAQCKVVPVMARAGTLLAAIESVYMRLGKETIEPTDDLRHSFNGTDDLNTNELLANLEHDSAEAADEGPQIEQSDNSLVKLINTMILEARQLGVSDIHVECPPSPQKVRVRFRRDGVLKPYIELPPSYRQAIVARLKIMCDLDISERRKPQDGKMAFSRFVPGQRLELRIATIPTANGLEDVVLRLLSSSRALPLDAMNLQPDVLARFKAAVERPYGLVLCAGPTGSGKTTTLHAALGHINTPERKIWTAEDPVEITQPGLRQVQVNPKIDWTFAKALRAFLRADPDVVMVGEVRDEETAQMAVEASLTGHLVLSTLHTNSATETVTRLLDMGIDPFSFSDSLLAVLAQRLVRKLCRHCTEVSVADDATVKMLVDEYLLAYPDADIRPDPDALLAEWRGRHGRDGQLLQHHAQGCQACGNSGFDGRVGLHELLSVGRELRPMMQARAPAAQLQRQAMIDGMRTLRQDGILKVLAGFTTIEEVRAISNL